MKTAVRVLVIIAVVIGVIWSIVGFFGILVGGSMTAAFQEEEEAKATVEKAGGNLLKMVGSFVVMIAGLIFGIIAAAKETRRVAGIVLSALLIVCGVAATAWASFVAGPMYVIAGILALIASATAQPQAAA